MRPRVSAPHESNSGAFGIPELSFIVSPQIYHYYELHAVCKQLWQFSAAVSLIPVFCTSPVGFTVTPHAAFFAAPPYMKKGLL